MNLFLCVCVCMTVACNREIFFFFFLWLFVVGGGGTISGSKFNCSGWTRVRRHRTGTGRYFFIYINHILFMHALHNQ